MLSPRAASVNRFPGRLMLLFQTMRFVFTGSAGTLARTEREARTRVLACYASCADEGVRAPSKEVNLVGR
jgi:hypothetical protein